MNRKAFTLIELVVSFAMISVLSLVVFRTVINVQQKQLKNIAYSNYVTFHSAVNTTIQRDLTNKIIEELEFCGRNCYKIKYANEATKELSINTESRTIKYGSFVERLPDSFSFYMDMIISEDVFDIETEGEFNAMLTIRIPISSTLIPNERDLIYVYQYNSESNPIVSKIS